MKPKIKELDVDFIGGQEAMSKEEELAISEFLNARKMALAKKNMQNIKTTQPKKVIA